MNELPVQEFEKAILATHGATAVLEERVLVKEVIRERYKSRGRRATREQTVWEGEVLVFQLENHSAPKCYAWSVDGRVTAVLHDGPIDSPQAAVRAAIVAEYRAKS